MCGIVGMVMKNGFSAQRELLQKMTDALAHRGPNDQGVWFSNNLGLGHRRLAIIDPDGARQPMASPDNAVVISFNGEIYNFKDLKQQLITTGHEFLTRSDTEVVLHAWMEWGEDCVHHLRGMFAFCIVDTTQRRLFLARDHFGIKPLFFVETEAFFAFASELQSLMCIPDLDTTLDLLSIDHFLQLQYIPAPRTVFEKIKKLPPAHSLRVDIEGRAQAPQRFWRMVFDPDYSRTEDEWRDGLEEVVNESVRAHMIADVPFGAFLSGGIDSTVVVGAMARALKRPVMTFTIGFEDETVSELEYASIVAEHCQTEHHVEVLRPNAIEILPTLVQHYGEPFGDSSAIPTYYVSRLASQFVPMVLSGDGGDELFAGYHSYRTWMRWLHYDGTPALKRWFYPLAHLLRPERYPPRQPVLESWLSFTQWIGNSARKNLWKPEFRSLCDTGIALFEDEYEVARKFAPVQRAQSMDINTYLPHAILNKVDVASMISSLEVRTPLVDVRVAEFAAMIPPEMNFRRNSEGEFEGKCLLKGLLKDAYRANFIHRSKMGFGIPMQDWFGSKGRLREAIHDRLLSPSSRIGGFFETGSVKGMLKQNHFAPLWSLLFLEEWLSQRR